MTNEQYEKYQQKIIDYMLEGFPDYFKSRRVYIKNSMFNEGAPRIKQKGYAHPRATLFMEQENENDSDN